MVGLSFSERSAFYRNFAELLDAGVQIDKSFSTLMPKPIADRPWQQSARTKHRAAINLVIRNVQKGSPLHRAMVGFPEFDRTMVKAGEKTGSVPEILRFLSSYYDQRNSLVRSLKAALAKPGFLFLSSVLLRSLPDLVGGTLSAKTYLLTSGVQVGAVALVLVSLFHLFTRSTDDPKIAALVWRVLHRVPWVGGKMKTAQLEKFFRVMEICFRSGTDLGSAIDIASAGLVNPALKSAVLRAKSQQVSAGFAAALGKSNLFDSAVIAELQSGETAGTLEIAFARITSDLRQENERAVETFRAWAPRVLYALTVIFAISGLLGGAGPSPVVE